MKEIPLTRGKVALVDDDDYERLAAIAPIWQAVRSKQTWYAVVNKKKKTIRMHRIVVNAPQGQIVDHRNGNGLDNRRDNLRFATFIQNAQNRRKRSHIRGKQTASPYKGVCKSRWRVNRDGWYSTIILPRFYRPFRGHAFIMGIHDEEIQAARAYDAAAQHFYGDFAYLNLPIAELPGC